MKPNLKDKVCLITGATQGIGFAIASALADEGVKIVIVSRKNNPESIRTLESINPDIIHFKSDVSKEDEVKLMVDKTISYFGKIDLFVNNVAAHWDEPVTKITSKNYFNSINTNLSSCIWACRDISKHMIKNKAGSILIIGSTSSFNPLPCEVSYRISKSALKTYMESLALELAPFKIRVNMLTPGGFITPMIKNLNKKLIKNSINNIPFNRLGNCEELGPSAILLLSDSLSPYTTGTELVVDGGLKLRPLPVYTTTQIKRLNK